MNYTDPKHKALIYCRVSTGEQVKSGLGLLDQQERCLAECTAKGYSLVETITDSESAKDLHRPQIQKAFHMLKTGLANTLVVLKLDRLTRSIKDLSLILETMEVENWSICSVLDGFDSSSATGRLQLNILMSVSQWEREVIAERTKAALDLKKKRGEKTGGSRQFGYDVVEQDGKKILVENKEEQNTIKTIINMRENGGMTYLAISKELEQRKIKNAFGGISWNVGTISRLLNRLGIANLRKTRSDKGKKRNKTNYLP